MERKLAAILCADVYGYSRLMGDDEEATLHTLTSHRKIIDGQIEQHRGRFVNSAGDSVLAEFTSVVEAVSCAVEIQRKLKTENAEMRSDRRMEFRIGINLGDVMVEGAQIYGDGVNVAARLEELAEPGGIYVSSTVYENIRGKLALDFEDLGEQTLKNIAEPVRVWRIAPDGQAAARPSRRQIPRRHWRGGVLSLAGLAIAVGVFVLVQHLSLKAPQTHASIPPPEKAALPLPNIPSIAVLPFRNESGDPKQEYFSDGISYQLINRLSRLPGLFVIAHNSSFAFKGKTIKESAIGRELGVKYLLEGSVRKAADQVRIEVELVDASSETEEWTARYDRPLTDILAVQDEIAGKVITTLGLLLKVDEMKLYHASFSSQTENVEAFDDFLRAIEYGFRVTKDDNARAEQSLQKAIDLDPKYAAAYAFLGWLHMSAFWNQWGDPRADLEQATELAHKALALDDSNSDALALLCEGDLMQSRYDQAIADGERAVAINPNYAAGYAVLADVLILYGKPEAAVSDAEKAIRLDPTGKDKYSTDIGFAYVAMGRYADAVPILKQSLTKYPNVIIHLYLIRAYVQLGRGEDARAEAAEVMRMSPQFTLASLPRARDEAGNKRFQDDLRKAGLK